MKTFNLTMIVVAVAALIFWLALIPEIPNEGPNIILKIAAAILIGATIGNCIGFNLFNLIEGE